MSGNVIKRRRFPRRRFIRPVGLLFNGSYSVAETREISEGGMLILNPFSMPTNSHVVLTFILSGGEHCIVQGEVRYEQKSEAPGKHRLGIAFLNIGFNPKRLIREYIAQKTEEEASQESLPPGVNSRRTVIAAREKKPPSFKKSGSESSS